MTKTTFELIKDYATGGILPPDARTALNELCDNIELNKVSWHDHDAEKIIKRVEEQTLELIVYYKEHHTKKVAFPHDTILRQKLDYYEHLLDAPRLFVYQKILLALILIATCVVFAIAGMTIGITIGAAIGGGAGSILPALGTAFGGAAGAFTGGIVGAVKGLSFGIALGAAIGFAVLGAIGVIAGWFIGKRVLPGKKPTGHHNLDQAMQKFAKTLHPDHIPAPLPATPRRSGPATAPTTPIGTPGGGITPYSPINESASAPLLQQPPTSHRKRGLAPQALFRAAAAAATPPATATPAAAPPS